MKILQINTMTGLHIPGVGELPKTLTVGAKEKYPDLKMEEHAQGVKLLIKGKVVIVPWSQIKVAIAEAPSEAS